jgi:hypothetical protein
VGHLHGEKVGGQQTRPYDCRPPPPHPSSTLHKTEHTPRAQKQIRVLTREGAAARRWVCERERGPQGWLWAGPQGWISLHSGRQGHAASPARARKTSLCKATSQLNVCGAARKGTVAVERMREVRAHVHPGDRQGVVPCVCTQSPPPLSPAAAKLHHSPKQTHTQNQPTHPKMRWRGLR